MPRRTTWETTLVNAVFTSSVNTTPISLLGDLTKNETQGMTLTRMILCLDILPSVVGGVDGVQMLDYAVGITSQDAFDANALPDPQVAGDETPRGWVYRCRRAIVDDTTPGYPMPHDLRDIRSQRRIDSGVLYFKAFNSPVIGTVFTVRVVGTIRSLFLLS